MLEVRSVGIVKARLTINRVRQLEKNLQWGHGVSWTMEEKTLQPLENPFGPKVLPMCPDRTIFVLAEEEGFEPPSESPR